MNGKIALLAFLLSVTSIGLYDFLASKTTTAEFVNVLEISDAEHIIILNESNETRTIHVPSIVNKLIQVNKKYFVKYEYREGETPSLLSIEPIE